MRVLEFQTHIPADGTLKVPADIAAQLQDEEQVRVVLVAGQASEDEQWQRLTTDRFFAGYSESDAIYDNL